MSSEAGGGSGVRGAIAAPAMELVGCTKSQRQVATLLSRLRSVDGVTRVTLSKSVRPDKTPQTATSGPTADGGGGTEAPDCGTGRPPEFEIVMFFERSKVPSSVEDITVQTAATAAAPAAGETAQTGTATTPQSSTGVTTPPADPADSGTATPASTPSGGDNG